MILLNGKSDHVHHWSKTLWWFPNLPGTQKKAQFSQRLGSPMWPGLWLPASLQPQSSSCRPLATPGMFCLRHWLALGSLCPLPPMADSLTSCKSAQISSSPCESYWVPQPDLPGHPPNTLYPPGSIFPFLHNTNHFLHNTNHFLTYSVIFLYYVYCPLPPLH